MQTEDIAFLIKTTHDETNRLLESLSARVARLETTVGDLAQCYDKLEKRPAEEALERQKIISRTILTVITTSGITALVGVVGALIMKGVM